MASNEDFKIYSENRRTTTMVQEITVAGLRLVSKKEKIVVEHQGSEEKPKMAIIRHNRSMHVDCDNWCAIQKTYFTEGNPIPDQVTETQMTPEELQIFEFVWRYFWKPQFNPQFE